MRNRALTPSKPRSEDDFIERGTAHTSVVPGTAKVRSKSKPVTVSLTDAYLNQVIAHLQHAASEGDVNLTRTHVIKAGLLALGELPPEKVIELMRKA